MILFIILIYLATGCIVEAVLTIAYDEDFDLNYYGWLSKEELVCHNIVAITTAICSAILWPLLIIGLIKAIITG